MEDILKNFSYVLLINIFIFSIYIFKLSIISIQTLLLFIEIGIVCLLIYYKITKILENIEYESIKEYYSKM